MDIKKISELVARRWATDTNPLPAYNPTATADWIVQHSGLPWLRLGISIPSSVIHQEILQIAPYLVDHRDDYGEHTGWKSFCIHGKSETATREDSYYNDTRPYRWTKTAQQLMPRTVDFFKNTWPSDSYARLRVMALEPGGYISVHRDIDPPGLLNPVNISITQPDDCNFYFENYGIVPFQSGEAYMLNISNRHTIFNNSNQTRYHLIVHQTSRTALFDLLVETTYHRLYAG